MKPIIRIIAILGVCVLMMHIPVYAEITPSLLYEWGKQPSNVQWNVYYQNTAINVVDKLPWESPSLYDTYAYTTLNVQNGYVQSVGIWIKRGYEYTLTHEVGHALSDYAKIPYWWCYQPTFIQIWLTERYNNAMMAQGIDDIREYFACAYDLYIRYPQILQQANPQTFNYITVVLNYT